MRDFIPKQLADTIRDRYIAGVSDAEKAFALNQADEDSLTGGLGQAISTPEPRLFDTGKEIYVWQIVSYKIRGRGKGAPEKLLGADGVFQVTISRNGETVLKKALPFQAKKNRSSVNRKLRDQATTMMSEIGDGIVVDFDASGYTAFPAKEIMNNENLGERIADKPRHKQLRHMLGDDFVNCNIGIRDLYYDPSEEKFISESDAVEVIATVIKAFGTER